MLTLWRRIFLFGLDGWKKALRKSGWTGQQLDTARENFNSLNRALNEGKFSSQTPSRIAELSRYLLERLMMELLDHGVAVEVPSGTISMESPDVLKGQRHQFVLVEVRPTGETVMTEWSNRLVRGTKNEIAERWKKPIRNSKPPHAVFQLFDEVEGCHLPILGPSFLTSPFKPPRDTVHYPMITLEQIKDRVKEDRKLSRPKGRKTGMASESPQGGAATFASTSLVRGADELRGAADSRNITFAAALKNLRNKANPGKMNSPKFRMEFLLRELGVPINLEGCLLKKLDAADLRVRQAVNSKTAFQCLGVIIIALDYWVSSGQQADAARLIGGAWSRHALTVLADLVDAGVFDEMIQQNMDRCTAIGGSSLWRSMVIELVPTTRTKAGNYVPSGEEDNDL